MTAHILDIPTEILTFIFTKLEPRDRLHFHLALPKSCGLWCSDDAIMALIVSPKFQSHLSRVPKHEFLRSSLYNFLIAHPNDIVARTVLQKYDICLPPCFMEYTTVMEIVDDDLETSFIPIITKALQTEDCNRLQRILESPYIRNFCTMVHTEFILRDIFELLTVIAKYASVKAWNMIYQTQCVQELFVFLGAIMGSFGSHIIQAMIHKENTELLSFFVQESKRENTSDHMFYASCVSSFFENGLEHIQFMKQARIVIELLQPTKRVLEPVIHDLLVRGRFDIVELYVKYLKDHLAKNLIHRT